MALNKPGSSPEITGSLIATIIDSLPDAMFALDISGRVIAWNQAMARFSGKTFVEMAGSSDLSLIHFLYGKVHPPLSSFILTPDVSDVSNVSVYYSRQWGYIRV